jgi:hypothetical protein
VTLVDLTKPVNYLRLSAVELTAVFNHPTINQHSQAAPEPVHASAATGPAQASAPPPGERPMPPSLAMPQSRTEATPLEIPRPQPKGGPPMEPVKAVVPGPSGGEHAIRPAQAIKPLPNLWLKAVLSGASLRQDWFTCLIYRKLAEHFGNSSESFFGPFPCWVCSLGDVEDISDPAFRGVFLTQRGWLGYLNQGRIARFRNEVAFLGTLESTIEGIGVSLAAAGKDSQQRIVFIACENYRTKFGLPELTVVQELARLREYGASLMSVNEVLQNPDPVEVIWTVPVHQEDLSDAQALEVFRPEPTSA